MNTCVTKLYKYGVMQFLFAKAVFFENKIILVTIVFYSKNINK